MMTINMLGKPCPIPVVEAKKALLQTPGVIILVDNSIAVQNLQKMAAGLGYEFSFEQKGEAEFAVTITKEKSEEGKVKSEERTLAENSGTATVLCTADQIGIGASSSDSDVEAAKKLMKSFLYSLSQLPTAPKTVLLLNTGVRMAVEGSDTLEDLKALANKGTDIRSCGQCLNYYRLTEKLAVGSITNMMDIVETLTSSARTITL